MDLAAQTLPSFLQLHNFQLDDSTVLRIFLPVCRALQAMHSLSPPTAHRCVAAELIPSDDLPRSPPLKSGWESDREADLRAPSLQGCQGRERTAPPQRHLAALRFWQRQLQARHL